LGATGVAEENGVCKRERERKVLLQKLVFAKERVKYVPALVS
jgi:hypothetical protein